MVVSDGRIMLWEDLTDGNLSNGQHKVLFVHQGTEIKKEKRLILFIIKPVDCGQTFLLCERMLFTRIIL